jgi:hypothetical protein
MKMDHSESTLLISSPPPFSHYTSLTSFCVSGSETFLEGEKRKYSILYNTLDTLTKRKNSGHRQKNNYISAIVTVHRTGTKEYVKFSRKNLIG